MFRRIASPCLKHRFFSQSLHTNKGTSVCGADRLDNPYPSSLSVQNFLQESHRINEKTTKSEPSRTALLSESLERLRLGHHHVPDIVLCQGHQQKREYILPTLQHNYVYKKTILDPITTPKRYELPTPIDITSEKLTPGVQRIVPIEDPHPLQKIIDQGVDITKEAAVLIQIRRRKMKKHQKRKWRKRMQFKIKARKHLVRKRKERRLREFEGKFSTLASEFNAEKFVNERLVLARKGGWNMDIWSEKRKKDMYGNKMTTDK